jgi:hypothetical protein
MMLIFGFVDSWVDNILEKDTASIFRAFMMPCRLMGRCQHFRETYKWRQYISPKHCYLPVSLHGIEMQNNMVILTAVRTPNLTIVLPTSRCLKWSLCFKFSDWSFVWISHHSHKWYLLYPLHPLQNDYPKYSWWRVPTNYEALRSPKSHAGQSWGQPSILSSVFIHFSVTSCLCALYAQIFVTGI